MPEVSFDELVEAHRSELLLHCYRLLGSLVDAEDVLQEVLLAAWRGLDGFEGRASPRSWLYRIATNRCLNALRDRGRRIRVAPVPPFEPPPPSRWGDQPWLQPYPDALVEQASDTAPGPEARVTARESVELAFVVALQRMPPRQAAALVLGDVLGYSLDEVASMLGTTAVAAKGLLQRARRGTVPPPGEPPPPPGSAAERAVVRRFAEALTADDIDGVVDLLTDDAWLSMPPAPHEYLGRAAIAGFLRASARWRGERPLRLLPTRANGQPAFVGLIGTPGPREVRAGVFVLTLDGDRLRGISRFLDDRLQERVEHLIGLPRA